MANEGEKSWKVKCSSSICFYKKDDREQVNFLVI